jgi:DNA-binding FadR family transcriptional regulator
MSFHAVCELFEMRLILEDAAAQLATTRATDHDIQELENLAISRLTFEKSQNTFSALVEANTNFHLAFAETTRNRRLVELLRQNLESTERLMYIELRSSGFREPEFHSFHERLVEALRERDLEAVRQAVWDDITQGQGATLTVRNLRAPRALLGKRYVGDRTRAQVKRVASASKLSDKS